MRSILIATIAVSSCLAGEVQAEPHIHVVVYADDAPGDAYAQSCSHAISIVNDTFNRLVPKNRFTVNALRSSRAWTDGDQVLRYLRNYQVRPEDTFVYLHASHGANGFWGHRLRMRKNDIDSSELRDVIELKRCKLRVILSNSCNNVPPLAAAAKAPVNWNPRRQGVAPVIESLFLKHSGTLHMNSAREGQLTFGAIFVERLFGYIEGNVHSRPTWREMDRFLDKELSQYFRQHLAGWHRDQKDWRVLWWKMADEDSRFGVVCRKCEDGLHIVSVQFGSPATRLIRNNQRFRLQANDHILEFNGIPTRTIRQLQNAVKNAPRNTSVTFVDGPTGKVMTMAVQL